MISSTKNILLTGGCSFSSDYIGFLNEKSSIEVWACDEINKKNYPLTWKEKKSFPIWPEIVSKEIKFNLINTSISGIGNDAIFHRLVDKIYEYKTEIKMVIVLWTVWNRKSIQTNNNGWLSTTFNRNSKENNKKYYSCLAEAGALNLIPAICYFYRYSQLLTSICKQYNIKLLQGQSLEPFKLFFKSAEFTHLENIKLAKRPHYFENWTHKQEEKYIKNGILSFLEHSSFNQLEQENNFIDWPLFKELGGKSFENYVHDNKWYVTNYDHHPNSDAHKFYANLILENIHEKNYI